jgi:alpha-beta hydrolase superfamily lysophospholipase
MRTSRKVLVALGAAVVAPSAAAYRFAIEYRRRAGFPARRPPLETPQAYGLPFEIVAVPSATGPLPGWFVPAPGGRPAPAIVLVHGWESNRARMLPNARFLHAAGFASLLFDVRGHGDNPPETLPISGAEFGADARAAVEVAAARPDVTSVGVLGHSMGAIGAALAAADDPRIGALVTTATPADPRRLTRRTFQLAGLTMPGVIAHPLAALTTRVYLRPRGHAPSAVSATAAVRRYPGPILIVHGEQDEVVGADNAVRLERAARGVAGREVELLILPEGRHRWLYEDPAYRGRIAAFLARNLAGAAEPDRAAARAVAARVRRPPDTDGSFAALDRPAAPAPSPAADGPDGPLAGPDDALNEPDRPLAGYDEIRRDPNPTSS